jgi:acetamidase/formamidase
VTLHELPLDAANIHGYFSRELEPVRTMNPGDSVRISVPNAGWDVAREEQLARRNPELDTGHPIAGPIEMRGARAGHVLAVRIDDVTPGSWGVTFGEGYRLDWELADEIGHGAGRSVRLAPFLGVLGMPPAEPGVHSTIPPRRSGGNIDCKELVAGTTLFLPVPVDGALFSAGDGHAAQGDGEVSGTAIEAPVEAPLTLDLRDDLELEWPSRASTAPGSRSASTSTSGGPPGSRSTGCSGCWSGNTASPAARRSHSHPWSSTCA